MAHGYLAIKFVGLLKMGTSPNKLMELKAAGWRRVWAIIKGARPEILDELVKRILVEEAKG